MKRFFVLSGGGCLGALQVGALQALVELGIFPDALVGCSVGALNGAYMAQALTLEQVERVANVWRQVTTEKVYPGGRTSALWRLVTGQDSLHDNRPFYAFLQEMGCTPALVFGGLQGARLYVTATHLRTGRLHVFGDDPNDRVLDALMASTALIPLHPPWEIDGEKYVDGGTVTPLPIRVALERGATEIFALHIYDPAAPPVEEGVHGVPAHISKAVDTMLRLQAEYDLHLAGDLHGVRLHYLTLHAPFAVEPTDFGHSEALIAAGHTQALAFLEQELKPALPAPAVQPVLQWWQEFWARYALANKSGNQPAAVPGEPAEVG